MGSEARRALLVTGGAGFIGSAFVRDAVLARGCRVVTLDRLTYAGHLDNLASVEGHAGHVFVQGDVCDRPLLSRLLAEHAPEAVVHFAAESHVDRSIDGPAEFVRTNVVGTFELLEAVRAYHATLDAEHASRLRMLHVSTDEVFGSVEGEARFDERTAYAPSSPYAASKAAADLFVRSYHRTYGVPVITTNASNTYGPFQLPEKLVPRMIACALEGQPLPVYGDGGQVRDWLFVQDHVDALRAILDGGKTGETYLVGARNERRNLDVVGAVCDLLDELAPSTTSYRDLITFVEDRPAHDRRYAIDPGRLEAELGWRPRHRFEDALRETVRWYVDHGAWRAQRITEDPLRRRGLVRRG
jgi:dTDP-glucose 4,6-dehydratase